MRTLTLSILCACAITAQAQAFTLSSVGAYSCVVSKLGKEAVADYPVVIKLEGDAKQTQFVVVDAKKRLVPSQLDDLNGDGRNDELIFLVDLKGKSAGYEIRPATSVDQQAYTPRVHAQMFHRNADKSIEATLVASSPTGDLYNQLHHHGPAFESELIAYRLYFDRKQTVDLYGKKQKQLELAESLWYPTDEQLAKGFGDDVLRVSGSAGVGTLKGWDEKRKRAIHIEPVTDRTARVVAVGPLRTIVDLSVEGWPYMGQIVNIHSRYTLYAGQRTVEVAHKVKSEAPEQLVFATGVQKFPELQQHYSNQNGVTAVWGRDWPVNDSVKYAKETVGLAVSLPSTAIVSEQEDKINYLYQIRPDTSGEIQYEFGATSLKESWGVKSAEQFFESVRLTLFSKQEGVRVEVKQKK